MLTMIWLLPMCIWCCVSSVEHKVVRNSIGEFFYLSFTSAEYKRPIPDETTISLMGFEVKDVPTVEDSYLEQFKLLPELQTLKMANESPDEQMRAKITKILILAHPSFILESYYFKGKLNPSIELIHDVILMAFRDNLYDSPIELAWLNSTSLSFMTSNFSQFGINNFIIPDITNYDWNNLQEDPRLMYRSKDNELLIHYHGKQDVIHRVVSVVCNVKPYSVTKPLSSYLVAKHEADGLYSLSESSSNTADFSNSVVIGNRGKNWVMFIPPISDRLMFITDINPMHIVELINFDEKSRNGTVQTVLLSDQAVPLPWLDEYGAQIRGGTPAILVPSNNGTDSIFLTFFHTVAAFQNPYVLKTYFMGALTFCPSYPFNIHTMSSRPIVPQSSLYEGEWVRTPELDYVVFPVGLVLLDNDTLLMSFGSQDKDGYVLKMSLSGLLASMSYVEDCKPIR